MDGDSNYTGKFLWEDEMSTVTKPESLTGLEDGVSPFIRYENGYQWPDLYTELDECLEAIALIHPLAELRRLAKNEELEDDEVRLLKLPLSHIDATTAIQISKDKKRLCTSFFHDILDLLRERDMLHSGENATRSMVRLSPTSIVAFDDKFSEPDLAYMVNGMW